MQEAAMQDFEHDRLSLSPKLDFSRREMLVTTLATGFALAVQPVAAQTMIMTDAVGLDAGEVKIQTADAAVPAYLAMPAAGGPFPIVLVVQEIFGVHEHIKDVCRRLAKAGTLAIAPELYARQGDVSKLSSIDEIRTIVAKVSDRQVMSDLDAAIAFAKASGKGNTAKLAVTGFCWGGRITWLYAAHNPGIKAGVAWYGRLAGGASDLTPRHPIDVAAELKAPVLGLYGGADPGIPLDTVEKMREALKKSKVPSQIIVYPNAQHGFHADYRPSYGEADAKDGWNKLQAWFKQHGAA
jgi:carboxymethylenebutenolidase